MSHLFGSMGLIDLFWNLSQDETLGQMQSSMEGARGRDAAIIRRLQEENRELQVRVGVLIRLLIERGVIRPGEYAEMVAAAQARLSGEAPH